ncbi:hypothetical protein MSG28_015409 [Choristoneura fumiferana]|uniref:Uncharacterized protein n=1 Tax=Choristoneura fumiferana TaxID=7141 RepID=A0ACC0KA64_CHOFU|nr:hypothetical protein MSG28_015409 [Choristoneura fumiferana]
MPELVEQMYCSQQIVIPPKFPYILKRYCKAAIKTQPYDLLRWSFEYFKALAEHRPPPVKLRLEYPVYSTEGGLTRGCLKVLAHQLSSRKHLPLPLIKAAWQGFCLDPCELKRVICLCEAYLREETIPFLHFIAVAGGLLTKSLTHTMILLCETLTKEPDGGSAAIPLDDFLTMYTFLARMDASKDVRYIDGYREGHTPKPETTVEEEAEYEGEQVDEESCSDDFWLEGCRQELHKLDLIDDRMSRTARLSVRLNMPVLGKIERSPSIERAGQIERENYLRDRKGRAQPDGDVEAKLRDMSSSALPSQDAPKEVVNKTQDHPKFLGLFEKCNAWQVLPGIPTLDKGDKTKEEKVEKKKDGIEIIIYDEDENVLPLEFYEPEENLEEEKVELKGEEESKEEEEKEDEKERIATLINELYTAREERLEDLEQTFQEISAIVDRFKSAGYDLGMVAGRQMSTTSGEFIVQHIEREIMEYIDEQIAILPDPDLKKKKPSPDAAISYKRHSSLQPPGTRPAPPRLERLPCTDGEWSTRWQPAARRHSDYEEIRYSRSTRCQCGVEVVLMQRAKPEEVEMIRNLLETFLDENMDIIVPEVEEVEEEELPIPNIAIVYAVPGIGPPVPEDMIADVEEYALDVSKVQAEVFMPRNIRHFMCPPLEQVLDQGSPNYSPSKPARGKKAGEPTVRPAIGFEEYKYGGQKKEELATGGMFTD